MEISTLLAVLKCVRCMLLSILGAWRRYRACAVFGGSVKDVRHVLNLLKFVLYLLEVVNGVRSMLKVLGSCAVCCSVFWRPWILAYLRSCCNLATQRVQKLKLCLTIISGDIFRSEQSTSSCC